MEHFVVYVRNGREMDFYRSRLHDVGRSCCVEIGDLGFFDLPAVRTESDIFFGKRTVDTFIFQVSSLLEHG